MTRARGLTKASIDAFLIRYDALFVPAFLDNDTFALEQIKSMQEKAGPPLLLRAVA